MKKLKKLITRIIGGFLSWLNDIDVMDDILQMVSKLGIKYHLIPGHEFRTALYCSKPGDIIVIRAFAEATSILIGAGFTHVAFKANDKDIYDATGDHGVSKRDILELMVGTQDLAVLRLNLPHEKIMEVLERAKQYTEMDIDYDYGFASNKSEMYCSEFIYHCVNDVCPGYFDLRERYGNRTITPEDLYKASPKKLDVKYEHIRVE